MFINSIQFMTIPVESSSEQDTDGKQQTMTGYQCTAIYMYMYNLIYYMYTHDNEQSSK